MAQLRPAPFTGYTVEEMHRWHQPATWQESDAGGPRTRYEYSHMAEFGPHAVILRAGPVAELPVALDPAIASYPTVTRLGELPLDAYVHEPDSGVDGVVILRQGQIVYEAYPRMRPLDKHILMSVTKPYTGLLIALLAERGQIDVHAPIETYLPELSESGWAGTSVLDILDMASGIDCREGDEGAYFDPEHPYYHYEASFNPGKATERTNPSTYAYMAELKRARPAGEAFEYTSVDTFVLGWLAERIINLPYHELVSQEIWQKIGAEGDGLLSISPIGAPSAEGGMLANLRDVARFGLLFTPSWRVVSDERVVSPTHLEQILHGGRPELFRATRDAAYFWETYGDDPPFTNSWQWDAVWEDGDIYKGGYHGQGLHVSPSRDLVVAYFGTVNEQRVGNDLRTIARRLSVALG
jgi:CubicO group peptidase (beta-lactamase class C family)